MKTISLINGNFEDKISVFDRGFSYGDGLFETMLWSVNPEKKICGVEFWNRHLKRLILGCEKIKIKFPGIDVLNKFKNKIIEKAIESGFRSGVLKIIITRGVGGRGYKYDENMKQSIIFLISEKPSYSAEIYKKGVNVKICNAKMSYNSDLAGIKHLNRLDSVMARSEWKENSIMEGIIIDEKNNIIEGTMTNIFFVKDNSIITPRIIHTGIKGILRQVLLEKQKSIIEKDIKISDINFVDSAFISNSIIKVIPIAKIQNIDFKINKKVKMIIDEFQRYENLEIS